MSSTHLSLHYHLVFGTKNHESLIASDWRARLHAFLGGVIRTLNGVPEAVGGVGDHVHLLVGLRATHTLSDVLREIKSVSSAWVHENVRFRSFAWQEGYGAFTVSASQLGKCPRLHSTTGGASSDAQFPGRICGLAASQWGGIR
jgi:REP element-mobilizing transposase RayT